MEQSGVLQRVGVAQQSFCSDVDDPLQRGPAAEGDGGICTGAAPPADT